MADFSRENLSTLDRDGISEEIFKLLWAKDELNFGPNLNIPDTVVYKYGQPVAWYFTSVNGRIKRKNKQNLVSAKIEEAFNKYVLGYDVLAYFITMSSEHERSASSSSANDGRGSAGGGGGGGGEASVVPETVIQYFDREGLQNFLYNHKKGVNGILQRFIEPKCTHNEVIRSIWSPKLCLLERAENIHELHDHRYGMYERCVVYEGPDYYFTSAPLRGPVLSGQLQKICESIVYHISEVTYGQKQVSRIVLNFKVDSRDKVWFLYSTSIRCDDMLNARPGSHQPGASLTRHLLNIDRVVSLPEEICLNPQKSYSRLPPPDRVRCLSCNEETLDNLRYPISYKAVIKHYDHVIYILRTSSGTTAEVLGLTGSSSAPPGSAASNSRASTAKGGVVVPWPPDKELIKAAGGVGFGCLQREESNSSASLHHLHHVRYRTWRDIQIPPMLAALHPKLSADTYAKCKSDPLFQNKTLQVCEACYLVYADFLTMLLRVGGNLQKLLSPDPAAPMTASSGMRSAAFQRPTSADWRAISSAMSQSRQSVSGFSRTASASTQRADEARDRAIGLRTDDLRLQPEVPSPIRNATDSFAFRSVVFQGAESPASPLTIPALTTMGSVTTNGSQADDVFNGGLLDFGSQSLHDVVHGYDSEKVQAMIADRERRFFKEISLNPQLKDQHPLMHLITAQQRLQLVDQQSGVLMSKAAAAQESIFPEKYGHQKSDKHAKFGAYGAEIPYAINGEIVLPSSLRTRRTIQAAQTRAKKQAALQQFLLAEENDPNQHQTQAAQTAGSMASSSAQSSSKQYRDFLANCLQKIESDLGEAVGYPPMKDEMIAEMNEAATTTTAGRSSSSPSRRKPSSVSSAPSSRKKGKDSKIGQKGRLATTLPAGVTPLSPIPALPRLASCPEVISHSKSEDNENPTEELKEEKKEEDKAQSPPFSPFEATESSYEE